MKTAKGCPSNGVNHFAVDVVSVVHTLAVIAVLIGVLLLVLVILDERGVFGYRLPWWLGRAWLKYGFGAAAVGLLFLAILLPRADTCILPF